MASAKKIVVVFGATGKQGGSVINSILDDPDAASQFTIRGLTRDPSRPAAQALAKRGVECVKGDLDDPASITAAFKGAYAAFAVTNYWDKMDGDLELAQGKGIADTAKAEGLQHLVWSSLLNINKLTNGKFPSVYHFDRKADVEEYIRELGIPATFFMPGFYMSNLPGAAFQPSPEDKSKYIFAFPGAATTTIPLFAADVDTGKFVKAILTNRDKLLGQRVYGATDYYDLDQIMQTFKEAYPNAGSQIKYVHIPKDDYKKMLEQAMHASPKVQEEMWENMTFMNDFGYYGKADLGPSLALLKEKPTSFAEFLGTAPMFKDLS